MKDLDDAESLGILSGLDVISRKHDFTDTGAEPRLAKPASTSAHPHE